MKNPLPITSLLWLLACPTSTIAQTAPGAPIGPCSPYAGSDGDIPSEMPGCGRHLRPAPGSLADELQFRRGRGADESDAADPDDAPPPSRRRGRRAGRLRDP